jgi:hypothetical protein
MGQNIRDSSWQERDLGKDFFYIQVDIFMMVPGLIMRSMV